MKKREPTERIGLRALLLGTAGFAVLAYLVLTPLFYHLFSNPFHRWGTLLALFLALIITLRFIARIYTETLSKPSKR